MDRLVLVERRTFLQSLAAMAVPLPAASCMPETYEPLEPAVPPLSQAAAENNSRLFGAAMNMQTLVSGSAGYETALRECSSITAEWSFKWDKIAPRRDEYDFEEADHTADFARRHNKKMRGHTLLWHLGMPEWADTQLAETGDWELVRAYIQTVVPRYADIVDEWDVVNEPIDITGGDNLRQNQFLRSFGKDYIERAFWEAHEAAPQTKLFINEYGLEYASPEEGQRRLSLIRLMEYLVNRGVPVHGLGLQAHLDLRKGAVYADGLHGLLRDIAGLGLTVSITELDVREQERSQSLLDRDRAVADEVQRYLDIVLNFHAVKSVTTWGLSDKNSWLATSRDGKADNRGLPYDTQWKRKPMRAAIESALSQGRPSA